MELLERAPAASPFVPVACQSAPVGPPCSSDTKSVISFVQGFHEEVRPTPSHVKMLISDILSNFLFVYQHFPSECCGELEYIGEYIEEFVNVTDIPPETLKDIIACLEDKRVDLVIGERLLKKLSSV
ncbi:unnamed protein product [Heligmosomoides polygyrus]|uniref:Vacuolar protein sorting-associated protein 28 homolog n=1 Tax=Heligmosomoides polygyrus TaxID=6339 RepID=A0A183GM59_HELPZ|nr:unnamed protein product [Heligmosomoides polygyrus]